MEEKEEEMRKQTEAPKMSAASRRILANMERKQQKQIETAAEFKEN